MRARVCTLAAALPRLVRVVKERRSALVKLTGCAFLGILAEYRRQARSYNDFSYGG